MALVIFKFCVLSMIWILFIVETTAQLTETREVYTKGKGFYLWMDLKRDFIVYKIILFLVLTNPSNLYTPKVYT